MRLGILSDAHGHLGAFETGLETLRAAGAQQLFFLGDAVGYVPDPGVAEQLRGMTITALKGNHEAMLFAADYPADHEPIYQLKAVKARLSVDTLAFLEGLNSSEQRTIDGRRCLFVHGNPKDPVAGCVYPDTDLAPFADVPTDVVFMGHTHHPSVRLLGDKLFVGVGSCGLPRDADGRGSACLFDTGTGRAEILRFDISESSRRLLCRHRLHETVSAHLTRSAGAPADG